MASSFSPGIISDQQSGKSFFATGLPSYGTFTKDGLGYIWTKGSSNTIYKISVDGIMSDRYTIAAPEGYSLSIYTLKVDPTNNIIYVGGSLYSTTFGTYKQRAFIAKLNIASGVPVSVWLQSVEAVDSIKYQDTLFVGFDSSQNAYLTFTEGVTNNDYASLNKFNSSGAKQWTVRVSSGTLYNNVRSGNIAIDSSSNVYMVYHSYNTNNGQVKSFILKVNSSGSVIAHKMINYAWFSNVCHIMANGDILVGSFTDIYAQSSWWLNTQAFVRLNSSLTSIVSQAKINTQTFEKFYPYLGSGPWQMYGDDLYFMTWGYISSTSLPKAYFIKYSTSSGTISLAREFYINNAGTYASGTGFDISGDSIMFNGYGSTFWFAKMPKDGSGTGTYYVDGFRIDYKETTALTVDSPGYFLESPTDLSVSTTYPASSSIAMSSTSAVSAGAAIEKIKRRKVKKK